jgi:L-fucose isomerase-like protein
VLNASRVDHSNTICAVDVTDVDVTDFVAVITQQTCGRLHSYDKVCIGLFSASACGKAFITSCACIWHTTALNVLIMEFAASLMLCSAP